MAFAPPFVEIGRTATHDINSTPLRVFASDGYPCDIRAIRICSTSGTDIFVSFSIVSSIDETVIENGPFDQNIVIQPGTALDILQGSTQHMKPEDELYAQSSSSGDTFSCHVSFFKYVEPGE